jgi:hypothetical protein
VKLEAANEEYTGIHFIINFLKAINEMQVTDTDVRFPNLANQALRHSAEHTGGGETWDRSSGSVAY